MAMAAMFYAAANGSGFFLPVRSIAATWYGANALLGGAGVLIAGLATHLGTSAFGGVVFAALPSSRKSATVALLSGLVWGVVVWAILSIAVMPWLNPTMYAGTVGSEPVWWFVLHLIYGGMLGSHTWSCAQGFCALAGCRGDGLPTCSLKPTRHRR